MDEGYVGQVIVPLMRRAFPRDAVDRTICAWCGAPRGRYMALCREDWRRVSPSDKARYLDMDIFARAQWIIDHIPSMA